MESDENPGTGALNVTDEQAGKIADAAHGVRITIDQLREQIAAVTYTHGAALFAHDVSQIEMASDHEVPRAMEAMHCLTLCTIVLRNGFTVVGKSACADPKNYDAEFGRKLARDDAERQAWGYLAFRLRDKITAQAQP